MVVKPAVPAAPNNPATVANKMDFLKKHYEKLLLGVVLIGLLLAIGSLPILISREKGKLEYPGHEPDSSQS